MHPLEIIVSVDRVQTAKDLQPNAIHSQAATSDQNVKKLHDAERLERETVVAPEKSDKYEAIDPDDKGKKPPEKKKNSSESKTEPSLSEEGKTPSSPNDKGPHLDIIA